jgi:hypothetical protein
LVGKPAGTRPLRDLGVDGKAILKQMLEIGGVLMLAGFI